MSTKINIARYNTIQTDVDDILGIGANGYGQSNGKSAQITIPNGTNRTIQATEVNNLVADLRRILIHQDGIDYSSTIPTVGRTTKITEDYFANVLKYYCDKAKTNRWKMSSIASQSTTAVGISSTRNTGWNDVIVHEVSANYSSESNARYFFNAGGEIILTTSLTGNNTTKSNAWATMLNGVGSIVMNHEKTESSNPVGTGSSIGYYSLTSTYQQVYSCACSSPYTANVYSVWAKKDGQFVSVKAVFTDAYVDTPDSLVTGTISSTVKYRIASASGTASAPGVSLLSNAPTLSNITNLSDSGVSQSNTVVLSPNPASEGHDLTAVINTYPALPSVWYKLVGAGVGNRFAVTTAQKTLSGGTLTFTLPIVMDPTTSGSGPVSMELWDKDPATQGTIKLTTSAAITVTDTPITITLAISTPLNATLNETSARTGNFLITSNLPNSTLAITATETGASVLTVPATVVTNSSGSATFAITVNPDYKTTGDLLAGIKVSLGSVDSNVVQVTIQDTSKPIVHYTTTKDPVNGDSAFTYDNDLHYSITGGLPNGYFQFKLGASGVYSSNIQLDANGAYPSTQFNGLPAPGTLHTYIKFLYTNNVEIIDDHAMEISSDTQSIVMINSPRDIPAMGSSVQFDFKLTKCHAQTVINWKLVGTNLAGITLENSNNTSGTITTTGNAGDGFGSLVLKAGPAAVKGTSFTIEFSTGPLTTVTDPIRVIDIFPLHVFNSSPVNVYLPTAALRTTIEARGGAGGGAGANSYTNPGDGSAGTTTNSKGGSGGLAGTILSTHTISQPELVVTAGLAGKGGLSGKLNAGAAAGGAGGYPGGIGAAAGGGNGGSGSGGGGGGASTVVSTTTTLVVAGGGGGGGGGANTSYGNNGGATSGLTTTMPKIAGGNGITHSTGGASGGGGGGGNGGTGGDYGLDNGRHSTGGTAGLLSYDNSTLVGSPILLNKYSVGGVGALNISKQDGSAGSDGEVVIYVAPLELRFPTVKWLTNTMPNYEYDVSASDPLKDGSDAVTGYTIIHNNVKSKITQTPLSTMIGSFQSTQTFSLTADNQFGNGIETPVAVETADLYVPNKPGSLFGTAVALSNDGNTLVVGSPLADTTGAVYVYTKTNDRWDINNPVTLVAVAPGALATGDQFGFSVAITDSGDRIVVGATGANLNRGSWYVYYRNGTSWLQEWYGIIDSSGDALGSSVSINSDGTKVVIGSEKDDNGATNSGRIRVFKRVVPANTWSFSYGAGGSEGGAYFGWSTKMSGNGNRIITGQYAENNNGKVDNGSVAIHKFTTAWSLEAWIYAPEVTEMMAGENFGWAVTINQDGTKVAVSAPKRTIDGAIEAGIVFTYTKSATGNIWDHEDTIRSPNAVANAQFGYSLSMNSAGTSLLIGENYGNPSLAGAGIAYLYKKTGNSWILDKTITASDKTANAEFGSSVSLNATGDLAVIGAPNTTNGTAYTFQV